MSSSPRAAARPTFPTLVALAAVMLAAQACSGDSPVAPEPDPVVSGSWTGTSQGITLNLVLAEGIGGAVAGSGNMAGGELNLALIVRQGTHVYPDLTLVLGAQGYEDFNFTGRMNNATGMTGTLNGSGFDDFDFNLVKR